MQRYDFSLVNTLTGLSIWNQTKTYTFAEPKLLIIQTSVDERPTQMQAGLNTNSLFEFTYLNFESQCTNLFIGLSTFVTLSIIPSDVNSLAPAFSLVISGSIPPQYLLNTAVFNSTVPNAQVL